jgi:DNA-binding transcriptional regulator LsrR (DeoR family)
VLSFSMIKKPSQVLSFSMSVYIDILITDSGSARELLS